jgi:type VI secretion system protein VasG
MLGGIARMQLNRIGKRIEDKHKAKFIHDDAVVGETVAMCNDPDSGGRMVDNIVTNTLLSALSRQILNNAIAGEEMTEAKVEVKDGEFGYGVG